MYVLTKKHLIKAVFCYSRNYMGYCWSRFYSGSIQKEG